MVNQPTSDRLRFSYAPRLIFSPLNCVDTDDDPLPVTITGISGMASFLSFGLAFPYPYIANICGSLSNCSLLKCFEHNVLLCVDVDSVKSARLQ